jgi:hypothetical protein
MNTFPDLRRSSTALGKTRQQVSIFDTVETEIRAYVRRGEARCPRGFLEKLHETLLAEITGLVVMQRQRNELQTVFLFESQPPMPFLDGEKGIRKPHVELRSRQEVGRRPTMGMNKEDKRFFASIVGRQLEGMVTHEEHVRSLVDRLKRSIGAVLGVKPSGLGTGGDQGGGWKKHTSLFTVDCGAQLYLLRVWPTPEWRFTEERSAWVFIINPRLFPPHPLEPEREYLKQRFYDLLNEWFVSKSAVLDWRASERHSSNEAAALSELYKQTLVWPIEAWDFESFLGAFTPRRQDGPEDLGVIYQHTRYLRELAQLTLGASSKRLEHRCANCPGIHGCPQDPHQSQIICALAGLHGWSLGFHRHNVTQSTREVFEKLLEWGIDGLLRAADMLDSEGGHPLEFSNEAAEQCAVAKEENGKLSLERVNQRQRAYERKLLRFFVARAILESYAKLARGWWKHPLQRHLLEYPAALARLSTMLLSGRPWTAEMIETLIEVLAGYVHQVLGLPARLDLAMHLRQTLRGETALHTLKQRYRDHFFHTVEVSLIGDWLLRSRPDPGIKDTLAETLVDRCRAMRQAAMKMKKHKHDEATKWHVPETAEQFHVNWWLAAITHDTAYGIDVLQGTLKLLDYFKNHKPLNDFTKAVQSSVKQLSESLRPLAQEEFSKDESIDKGDHGLIAAGHLAESLSKIDKKIQDRYWPAVRAVAMHNSRHPKVDAVRDPIAALLILCDTAQDWWRSQLGFTRSPAEVLSRIVEGGITPSVEDFGPVESFFFSTQVAAVKTRVRKVKIRWKPTIHIWNRKKKLTVTLHYAPWMTEKLECRERALFTWADTTYNLQRVDYSGWALKLELVQRTPYAEPWRRKDALVPSDEREITELERFAAMVQEQSGGFLQPWLDAAAKGGGPLGYKRLPPASSEKCGWEEVTFRLCELGQEFLAGRPLMAGDIGRFNDMINNWSKRLKPMPEYRPEQQSPC